MRKAHYACGSVDHQLSRRRFLQRASSLTAGSAVIGGLGSVLNKATANELQKNDMRVVVFNMAGGLSQLESWDPKPKTKTGGPFRAIPTSVPGIHISELLPKRQRRCIIFACCAE